MADAFSLQESRNPVLIVPFAFHEGWPEGLTLNVDPGIFHDRHHVHLQTPSGWRCFYIQNDDHVEGILHIHLEAGEVKSPYRSPFGSYLFSDAVNEAVLTEFVTYCEHQLKAGKAKTVTLKNQPEVYSAGMNQLLLRVLKNLEYQIAEEETSAVISVTNEDFESGLHRSERKRLRKCRDGALTFDVMPTDQLHKIYSFLEACREEKGYSLSMSLPEMEKLVKTFPDRMLLTTVVDKSKLVAANISIRIYNHVLYNFYHDHASEYDLLSPVVLLNEGLYHYCQNNNIRFLDLGTSSLGGELNESLLNFKLHLGAKISAKRTFTKNLD